MTIVSRSDDATKEQIMKQLNRLIEVVRVTDLTDNEYVEREMLLVKVRAQRGDRDSLAGLAELFRGRIVDVAEKSCTVELTGDSGKIDAFLRALDPTLVLETVRTGATGISRGERILRP